jgi:hypothetical protein
MILLLVNVLFNSYCPIFLRMKEVLFIIFYNALILYYIKTILICRKDEFFEHLCGFIGSVSGGKMLTGGRS